MKFALFIALLAIAASSIIAQRVHIWGDVYNSRLEHEQRVFVRAQANQVQSRNITYRTVSLSLFRPIYSAGIIAWLRFTETEQSITHSPSDRPWWKSPTQ